MDKQEFINELENIQHAHFSDNFKEKIYKKSITCCDKTTKAMVFMEELAELSQQISKYGRDELDAYGMLEEISDVHMCLDMLCIMLTDDKSTGITLDDIEKAFCVKLNREYKRRCK